MDKAHLDRTARHLIRSYQSTAVYSSEFFEEHKSPPTLMSKVHHMRSAFQAALTLDERYEVVPAYSEFGRVHFIDGKTGPTLLLRSAAAVAIEKAKRCEQIELFSVPANQDPARVQMLVYDFEAMGVTLSVAETARRASGSALIARGAPIFAGFWPYASPEDGSEPTFDQKGRDAFGDVGDLRDDQDGLG